MSNTELEAARALVAQAEADARAERRQSAQAAIDAMDVMAARLTPAIAEIRAAIEDALPEVPDNAAAALRMFLTSMVSLTDLPASQRRHQEQILRANREPDASESVE